MEELWRKRTLCQHVPDNLKVENRFACLTDVDVGAIKIQPACLMTAMGQLPH